LVHWVKCMCFSSEKRMLKQLDIDHVRWNSLLLIYRYRKMYMSLVWNNCY
jgi:hypothetical protein